MGNPLDYRDGHEQTDVAPVLVDRLADGGVRGVVRYPRDLRVRARNRFVIAAGAVIAWGMVALWIVGWTWPPIVRAIIGGSFWPLGPAVVIIMAIAWRRAQRLYVIEADPGGLSLEMHGVMFGPRSQRYRREWIREIRLEKSLSGRTVAVTIVSTAPKLTRRLFDDLEERHLTLIVDALREALALPTPEPNQTRPAALAH